MSDVVEKLIDGLNKEQWTDRYVEYVKKHSYLPGWMAYEWASISWDESTDESPEECAQNELEIASEG